MKPTPKELKNTGKVNEVEDDLKLSGYTRLTTSSWIANSLFNHSPPFHIPSMNVGLKPKELNRAS